MKIPSYNPIKITCQKNPMNPMTIPLIIPHYRYDKFQVIVPRCSTSFTTCSRSLAPPPPLPRCAGTAWWWPGAMWPWAGMWRTRRRGSKAHGERPWEMLVLIGFIWYIWFYMVLYGFIWFYMVSGYVRDVISWYLGDVDLSEKVPWIEFRAGLMEQNVSIGHCNVFSAVVMQYAQ